MQYLEKLSEEIITHFSLNNKTIFTAESCTGGLVAGTLTEISNSSKVLIGGIVSYANTIKKNILSVSPETLEKYGPVSFKCTEEMAQSALKLSSADYIIANTGFAGPIASSSIPIGTAYIAVLTNHDGFLYNFFLEGDRHEIRLQIVELSLKLLLDKEKKIDFFDKRLIKTQHFK